MQRQKDLISAMLQYVSCCHDQAAAPRACCCQPPFQIAGRRATWRLHEASEQTHTNCLQGAQINIGFSSGASCNARPQWNQCIGRTFYAAVAWSQRPSPPPDSLPLLQGRHPQIHYFRRTTQMHTMSILTAKSPSSRAVVNSSPSHKAPSGEEVSSSGSSIGATCLPRQTRQPSTTAHEHTIATCGGTTPPSAGDPPPPTTLSPPERPPGGPTPLDTKQPPNTWSQL